MSNLHSFYVEKHCQLPDVLKHAESLNVTLRERLCYGRVEKSGHYRICAIDKLFVILIPFVDQVFDHDMNPYSL